MTVQTRISAILLPLALSSALAGETHPRISQITPPQFQAAPVRAVDMDGDGDMDLLREGYFEHGSVWIENLGSRMFAEAKVFRFDESVESSSYGDLNGDGRMDVLQTGRYQEPVTTRSTTASISGQVLTESLRVNLGILNGELRLVELMGDARVEILWLETGESENQTLTIGNLLEDGSLGILAGPYNIPAGVELPYAKAVDADADGDLDLHVGGWILERTGPQTFSPDLRPAVKPTFDPEVEGEAKWADLDGDGFQDVYTFDDDIFRWAKNSGAFSFVEQSAVAIEGNLLNVLEAPASAALLAFSDSITNGSTEEWHIKQVLVTGEVVSNNIVDASGFPLTVVWADPSLACDLDGDGRMDVFRSVRVNPDLPNQYEYPFWYAVDWGNPAGFEPLTPIAEAPLIRHFSSALADFDSDGDKDLVVGPDGLGRFVMRVNVGSGTFQRGRSLDELLPVEFEEIGVWIDSIRCGDVDADGDPDLMVNLVRKPSLGSLQYLTFFALNSGNGLFTIPEFPAGAFDFITGGKPCDSLYDWDGDGDLDAMRSGAWQENEGGVLSPSHTPLLSAATVIDFLGNPILLESFRTGDLDGDGRSDIISEVFSVTYGEPEFVDLGGRVESSTMGIGFSDAFGVIEEVAEVPIQIYGSDLLGNPVMAGSTAIIDVNMDGHNDLVFTSLVGTDALGNMLTSSFWKRNPGNGSRLVANWVTLPFSISLGTSEPGDFDGDGVADYSNGAQFLTPRPSGPLISPTYDFTGGSFLYKPYVAHLADLDGDGDEDLIVSSDGELNLVRNLIIDERSGVAARMRADGVLGKLANPEEDADGDGRCNAFELLQGTDPLLRDAANPERSQPSLTVDGSALTIRYENRPDAAELDLSYVLECSDNLVDWIPMENADTSNQLLSDGWRKTALTQEEMQPRAFYRVRMRHEVPAGE